MPRRIEGAPPRPASKRQHAEPVAPVDDLRLERIDVVVLRQRGQQAELLEPREAEQRRPAGVHSARVAGCKFRKRDWLVYSYIACYTVYA